MQGLTPAEAMSGLVEQIARTCHEVNKVWCEWNGDDSQEPWDYSAEWQKNSARQGVIFCLNNPGVSPRQQHQNWCKDKQAEGWVYGPVKDPSKKQHPCLVEYEQLSDTHKFKDALFQSVVKSFIHK